MTTPNTTKATTTTQPQPTLEPQRRSRDPQHRSRPSHDDELIEDTFKDSRSRCRWSPYWYVTIHGVSCVAFGFTRGISGVPSRSNCSAAVAELRLPVASFAAAPSFNRRVFFVDRCNLGPRDSRIAPQRWRTNSPHLDHQLTVDEKLKSIPMMTCFRASVDVIVTRRRLPLIPTCPSVTWSTSTRGINHSR